MQIIITAVIVLIIGDFFQTFFYHVPEHIFGKYHNLVHHNNNRSFMYYIVKEPNKEIILNGLLSSASFVIVPLLLMLIKLPLAGIIIGLILAEVHVIFRHSYERGYKTPEMLKKICDVMCVVTPEIHEQHHKNIKLAYGDIFTFYDGPAKQLYDMLRKLKKKMSN